MVIIQRRYGSCSPKPFAAAVSLASRGQVTEYGPLEQRFAILRSQIDTAEIYLDNVQANLAKLHCVFQRLWVLHTNFNRNPAEITMAIFQCQDGIRAQTVLLSCLKLNGLDGAFSRRVRHPDLRIDAAVVLFESLPPIVNPSPGIAYPRCVRRGVRQRDHREAELSADRVGQKRLNRPM